MTTGRAGSIVGVKVLRHATATLPDGTRLRRVRATVGDGLLRLYDARSGAVVFEAATTAVDVRQKRWTVDTEGGPVLVRSGCGCGGR